MLSAQGYQMLCGGAASPVSATVARVMQMCVVCPDDAADYLVTLLPEELAVVAKDCQGSRYLQKSLSEKKQLRKNVLHLLVDMRMLVPMAMDCFANFVVQKMLGESDVTSFVANALLENALQLSCHRYACRVIQKLVTKAPRDRIHKLFGVYSGNEGEVAKNQHANHILQRIMEVHPVEVYSPFVEAIAKAPGITNLMLDKYGCRVVQLCLEKTVIYCFNPNVPDTSKRAAYEVLHLLMTPILEHARALAENENANYIVQYVLRTEQLEVQRQYIVRNSILHNVLWLSQGKFSSHVVEQALCHAGPDLLGAMFDELLNGYDIDEQGRDAMAILLFDQYGNYVMQSLFKIAIEVFTGKRDGDKSWFTAIAQRVLQSEGSLRRYSSGKKLLHMLAEVTKPTSSTHARPPFVRQRSSVPIDYCPMPVLLQPPPSFPLSTSAPLLLMPPCPPPLSMLMRNGHVVAPSLHPLSGEMSLQVESWYPFAG